MGEKISGLILAAGLGTRMKSSKPKALMEICSMPLVGHVLQNMKDAGVEDICVVVGHGAESVQKYAEAAFPGTRFAFQKEMLGTASAVMSAKGFLEGRSGKVLISCADSPLVLGEDIKFFAQSSAAFDLSALTSHCPNPHGMGRIVRTAGSFEAIVEETEADSRTKAITEVNSGCYLADAKKLLSIFPKFTNANQKREYFLTDAVALFKAEKYKVGAVLSSSPDAILAANDRVELARCEEAMRSRIALGLMASGVTVRHPSLAAISRLASIGEDTEIIGPAEITGACAIGRGNAIRGGRIHDSSIGDGNWIEESILEGCQVGDGCQIGPFAHLRPGSRLLGGNRVGNYVEVKASRIGAGTKIAHHTYVGDADVGEEVNFGCGVVTANFDGKRKHRTIIKDHAFIGCNVNLVAPVTVGRGALIGAGSTITHDVGDGVLALERSKQTFLPLKKEI
jgi:bifunctional UDP-N-acetylglucosamine pyrophosphorylase/glucosamine-1-phosphate N-acetyltransferase